MFYGIFHYSVINLRIVIFSPKTSSVLPQFRRTQGKLLDRGIFSKANFSLGKAVKV